MSRPGASSSTATGTRWWATGVQQITLSQVAAKEQPEVVGRLAALVGQTPAQIEAT